MSSGSGTIMDPTGSITMASERAEMVLKRDPKRCQTRRLLGNPEINEGLILFQWETQVHMGDVQYCSIAAFDYRRAIYLTQTDNCGSWVILD
jgi:hypothetical protein